MPATNQALVKRESSLPYGLKIGQILMAQGKINEDQVREILKTQAERSCSFGEAAIYLGFLTQLDIDTAISQQFNYAILSPEAGSYSAELHVATNPFGQEAESFRALRSQLMLESLEKGRRAITIVGPNAGSGCTYTAANLAIAFAQLGLKTCLIDANLRNPRIAKLFSISREHEGLSEILIGGRTYDEVLVGDTFPNLSIITSGRVPPNPQELLGRHELIWTLSHVLRDFDTVLFDTPAMNHCADARTVAARVGSALLVARRHQTLANDARVAVEELRSNGVHLIGTVLNTY
ncbi:polysaccharide biosynthesis tyrosine autokinase [Gimibacter soli]|uniref:non-specific protein-tyrosine kinase n=1 Tax=Gimibacter soli TaxID=3024400 RepID=A0AAE9XN08_9PROT|nr:polysaccharide biosynthesis tyrosine autokinase [Gimibacter soli]WCL53171.1 polysaccharide biosynthesis tyrosine autokinase [Gimibacter soli]